MFGALGARDVEEGALLPVYCDPLNQAASASTAKTLAARSDMDGMGIVAHTLRGDGFDASEDGTGRGTPLVPVLGPTLQARTRGGGGLGTDAECDGALIPVSVAHTHVMPTMRAASGGAAHNQRSGDTRDEYVVPVCHAFDARQSDVIQYGDKTGPLDTDGHSVAVAFSVKDYGGDAGDIAPTLRAGGHAGSHANGGVMPAVAFQPGNLARGAGSQPSGEVFPTLKSDHGRGLSDQHPHVMAAMQVRRLTPRECERLQGFPDDYTQIPYRNKPAADGPRYKAIGNSMAVPVMAWIGQQIDIAASGLV